jgi:DNA-directed RNA polymerase specialized sigma24 family protein
MVTLSAAEDVPAPTGSAADLLAVDRALNRMADLDPALYELLEMQAFAGLTIAEVAELRGVSSRTINRDLIKARALLQAWRLQRRTPTGERVERDDSPRRRAAARAAPPAA